MHHVRCMASPELHVVQGATCLHYAMNHIRFMISPELYVVQDGVRGLP
jgi:hypothetical protein